MLILSKFIDMWADSNSYYRHLLTNFVHLLILLVLNLDTYYFSTTNKFDLSRPSLAYILLSLLAICLSLNLTFVLKDTGIFAWITKKLKINPQQAP